MAVSNHLDTASIDIKLIPLDKEILALLADGRCTPGYLAKQTGEQQPWVSQRIARLVDAEIVTKIDRGLYELADEYRCEVTSDE